MYLIKDCQYVQAFTNEEKKSDKTDGKRKIFIPIFMIGSKDARLFCGFSKVIHWQSMEKAAALLKFPNNQYKAGEFFCTSGSHFPLQMDLSEWITAPVNMFP